MYDSTAGAYHYATNQTFSSSAAISVTLAIAAGHYSVDVWDSYGDGGTSGSVADANGNTLVSWTSLSYTTFGQYGFEVLVPSNVPGLFFSEYIEGSSNNKAIELYNASTDTINLDEYQIGQTSNGSTVGVWEYFHVFPTGATLAPGDVWVIANSSISSTYFDTSNADEVLGYPSVVHHNGDDARSILHIVGTDTVVVDLIGETGPDPGSGWEVAGVENATKDHTLIRKADVMWGNDNWTGSAGTNADDSEWIVYDQNYFTNLGGHPDDPCWEGVSTVTVVALSYGSEKNFMVQNAAGDTLLSCFGCMSSNSSFTGDICLTDGLYSFLAKDSWGDGWDGATFEITDASGGVLVSGTGPTSADGTDWIEYPFPYPIPPLPNTYVSGVVTDGETGAAVVGADVEFGGVTSVSGAAGAYGVYGAEPGVHALNVSAVGYLDSYFTLEIEVGDSLEQNVVLVSAESATAEEVYSTGFESGNDMGWTYTGGANPFELSAGFTFSEGSDTATVTPFNGDSMMVCSPSGYANGEFSWWMNLTATDMDLSGYIGAELTLQMNYWTEAGYDVVYLLATMPELYGGSYFYLDVNGDGVGNTADGISGFSDGWVELTADLSPWTGTEYGVEIAVLFVADATVDYGFGVAIDDVVVNGFIDPRPWVEELMAESFVNDQIALSWSDPSGGQRTMATSTITMNRTPVEIDPRNPRKAFEYETGEEEITINIPAGYSRDLVSYNVFRTDDYGFADYSGFDLIANTADASYTDASVDNDKLYYYFVTAVYDEGESLGSLWAAAGAGAVTDVAMSDLAVDFNDSTFGLWSTIVGADNGWGIGPGGTGFYEPAPHPDGGLSAYIDDDAIGSAYTSEGWLISPFFNMGDADHTTLTFDYFASSSSFGQELHAWAWIGWDTWVYVGELVANGEWQTVQVDMSGFAGTDHVRIYFYYTDNNGWTSSVAIDNVSIETLDGPANLTLTETIEDVTLNWTGLGGRAAGSRVNEYPDGVIRPDKELAQQARTVVGEIMSADFNIHSANRTFSRVQGDSIGNPFIIDALPYSVTASTDGFTDDYDVACNAPYDELGGLDVVYELTLTEELAYGLVVDLCESYYDTKVYIYANGDTNSVVACSDDYCTAAHGQEYTSFIQTGALAAGTYHIVVDGWDTLSFGTYVMEVYEADPPPPPLPAMDVMYNVYRDGNLIAGGLADSITSYLDETASLNDACYEVTALVRTLGVDGDTLNYVETGYSNEACGSVVNQPPGDFTLLTPNDGDTVMISLDNIGGNQLFAWNASVDPNGTPVEYVICYNIVAPFDQFCDGGITSTAEFVPLQDIVDYIDSLQQAGHGYTVDITWQVYASDGMDETEAGNGPRTITFDAGYALGVGDELGVPDVFALHQNYPNPFNPVTTIRFDIPQESHVRMDVYNVMGQRVRTLMNGTMQPGFHAVRWDGTNDMGKSLASGMYIYRIQSSKFTSVKKLVLMK